MKKLLPNNQVSLSLIDNLIKKALFVIALFLAIQFHSNSQGYYPDPKSDIKVSLPNSNVTAAQIIDQFNKARQTENTQLGTSLGSITAPTQTEWDAMTEKQQLYWILNKERQLRNLKPLEQLSAGSLNTIVQNYSDLMLAKQEFSHSVGGTTPWDRMNSDPAIKSCNQSMGENIYISWNFQYNNHVVTDALYVWMYDDAGSAWGHRRILLKTNFNDDSGVTGREGIVGLGVSKGTWGTWKATTVVCYNFFDPCSTWNFGTPSNQLPKVSITAPINNSTHTGPANITINASATDSDGTIAKVEFFRGTTKLGEDLTAPYSYTWSNVAPGTYTITAKATDNKGGQTTSSQITLRVTDPNAIATMFQNCSGDVSGYQVGLKVGNYTLAQLTALGIKNNDISAINLQNGYQVTLYDEDNFTGASVIITGNVTCLTANAFNDKTTSIKVTSLNNLPVVSILKPTASAEFTAPANIALEASASDTDGTIAKVEFFNGSTLLSTKTASPYTFAWNGVAAGTYTIEARATDNLGGQSKATVTVKVNPVLNVATLYQHCNYNVAGYRISLPVGNYTLAQLKAKGILDNDISGVKVQPGYMVVLYKDDNFGGATINITNDLPCLTANSFNDQTTSLLIKVGTTPSTLSTSLKVTNPVETLLTVTFDNMISDKADMNIFDSKGNSINRAGNITSGTQVDFTGMEKGVYFMVLKSGREVVTKKIIKQ